MGNSSLRRTGPAFWRAGNLNITGCERFEAVQGRAGGKASGAGVRGRCEKESRSKESGKGLSLRAARTRVQTARRQIGQLGQQGENSGNRGQNCGRYDQWKFLKIMNTYASTMADHARTRSDQKNNINIDPSGGRRVASSSWL